MSERTYPHTTHLIGNLCYGWCQQAAGAPIIDTASTTSADGWTAGSWVIRLRRTPGRALHLGWKTQPFIPVTRPRRLAQIPLIGALFRGRFTAGWPTRPQRASTYTEPTVGGTNS